MAFASPESRRAYAAEYYEKNKTEMNEAGRAWHSKNRESIRAKKKRHYEKYRDRELERMRLRRLTDGDRINAARRLARKLDPARFRAQELKKCFGITLEEYERMVAQQKNLCAICGKPETARHQNGKVRRLAVDHDHTTHVVRGLLCSRCNTLIGQAMEKPETLRRAARYLEIFLMPPALAVKPPAG